MAGHCVRVVSRPWTVLLLLLQWWWSSISYSSINRPAPGQWSAFVRNLSWESIGLRSPGETVIVPLLGNGQKPPGEINKCVVVGRSTDWVSSQPISPWQLWLAVCQMVHNPEKKVSCPHTLLQVLFQCLFSCVLLKWKEADHHLYITCMNTIASLSTPVI